MTRPIPPIIVEQFIATALRNGCDVFIIIVRHEPEAVRVRPQIVETEGVEIGRAA